MPTPTTAKPTPATATAKTDATEKPKSLSQKLMEINNKAFEERKKSMMSNNIGEKKAKRGPSMAGRISGLQGLQGLNTSLGKQTIK